MSMTWSRRALRFGVAVVPMVVWAVTASAGQAQQQNMPGMKMPADLGIVSGTVTKAADKAPVAGATVLATNTTNGKGVAKKNRAMNAAAAITMASRAMPSASRVQRAACPTSEPRRSAPP